MLSPSEEPRNGAENTPAKKIAAAAPAVESPVINLAKESIAQTTVNRSEEKYSPEHAKVNKSLAAQPLPLSKLPRSLRSVTSDLRDQYKELYKAPVKEYPDGTRTFHNATLYRTEGINTLFLKGDRFEMAFQHGRILQDEIKKGAISRSMQLLENALANSIGDWGIVNSVVGKVLHWQITDKIFNFSLSKINEETDGVLNEAIAMSDSTGFPVRDLVRALFAPEALLVLAKGNNKTSGQLVKLIPPVSNCSSFAAWGSKTTDGEMLIGRNMDFPLNGYYDRFPTVIYYEPTDGAQKYMTFVSSGVHNAGLNAMNESGIFISVHTIPTEEVSAKGVPAFIIGTEISRHAKTFDEAVEIFKRFKPPTGWSYLLASTKEGRVASVELSNQNIEVRESSGDFHVQTNHFLAPGMKDRNMFMNRSVCEDNDGRFIRIDQLLRQSDQSVGPKKAMEILADHVDPYTNQLCGLGANVGVHTTMTSVVVTPAKNTVYVANGMGPVSHNSYVSFPIVGSVDAQSFLQHSPVVIANDEFKRQHPEKQRAVEMFIAAKGRYENHNDIATAHALLKDAAKTDPSNPNYQFQAGIFALKRGLYQEALQAFDAIYKVPPDKLPAQLARLGHYYRGRTYAHLRQRSLAMEELKQVIKDEDTDQKLRTAAEKSLRRTTWLGWHRLGKGSLGIMMQQSDMLNY